MAGSFWAGTPFAWIARLVGLACAALGAYLWLVR